MHDAIGTDPDERGGRAVELAMPGDAAQPAGRQQPEHLGSSDVRSSAVAANWIDDGGPTGPRRTGICTCTRPWAATLRALRLSASTLTHRSPSTTAYITPAACGRPAGETVASTQYERSAMARSTSSGVGRAFEATAGGWRTVEEVMHVPNRRPTIRSMAQAS